MLYKRTHTLDRTHINPFKPRTDQCVQTLDINSITETGALQGEEVCCKCRYTSSAVISQTM